MKEGIMKFTLSKSGKTDNVCDLLVITTYKNKNPKKTDKTLFEACKTIGKLDKELSGHLVKQADHEGFSADESSSYITDTQGLCKANSIALLGLGDPHGQSVDLFRRAAGEAYKIAHKKHARKMVIVISEKTTVPLFDVVQALAEGIGLASYRFDRYRTKDKKPNFLKEIEFELPEEPTGEQKLALSRAKEIVFAVNLARDLINEGPMELNPQAFSEEANKLALEAEIDIEILDEKKLKKEKMGLLLAVASGAQSFAPPRLVRMHYKPKKQASRKVVLVGKGVTFDSGGLDIKTAEGMLDMKVDMSGAAAVLGTMYAVSKLKPKVEVVGYMALVENGVGPASYHPGDIFISRKGISVEINNTDAEGRLIMADVIDYACERDKPQTIIDVATLTGACMIALGLKTAGLFCNDDALAESIFHSGEQAGESFWRMPLTMSLKEGLKSPVADIRNTGDRYGGSITAALFLEEFVKKGTLWAHLDIAGPATATKPHSYIPMGGAGFGIRTLVDLLMSE